jgi:hypothetical protein
MNNNENNVTRGEELRAFIFRHPGSDTLGHGGGRLWFFCVDVPAFHQRLTNRLTRSAGVFSN